MNKKLRTFLLSIIAFLIVTLATTYGLWYVTRNQANSNIIATKCLDISLTNEENDITLTEAYPISDEEGLKLTPYTFTITNNCNANTDYLLNLELLGDSETSVNASAIKVSLNGSTTLLSNKETRETTIDSAYKSYQLMYGRLEANESEESSLRLWVDESAPVNESNKMFESKISIVAGQGIDNPFNEGTIAFDVVGNAGGSGYITDLSSEWQEGELQEATAIRYNGGMTYYWGTDYKFDSETGYTLSGDIVSATPSECRAGTKDCGQYTLLNSSYENASAQTLYIVTSFTNDAGNIYITAQVQNAIGHGFGDEAEEDIYLYKAKDDLGTSYYYRGKVQNNYVKFGKLSKNDTSGNAGEDMYWRIIRVNGDGTIRMIYDGTEPVTNGMSHTAVITTSNFGGANYNNINGVGYKNSDIKKTIDNWYNSNLKVNYGSYIADEIFCDDTEYLSHNVGATFISNYRVSYNLPRLTCNQSADKYTVNSSNGNGYLSYPIALITVDEATMAMDDNKNSYLISGEDYWTISTASLFGNFEYGLSWFMITEDGHIWESDGCDAGIRPVINLKSDVEFTGDGTIDKPYEIVTE